MLDTKQSPHSPQEGLPHQDADRHNRRLQKQICDTSQP